MSDEPTPTDDGCVRSGRTPEGKTDERLDCPACPYVGRFRAQTDTLAGVTAAWCPECGEIDEPDRFPTADNH